MSLWLARPFRVDRLDDVRDAIAASARGDVRPLQALYKAAAQALDALDPDEVAEHRAAHRQAARDDRAAAKAAVEVADTWEGIVSVGATITDPERFRGFCWLAAQVSFDLSPYLRDVEGLRSYATGAGLPDTSPEDAGLYVALPALLGLGPEYPEEIEGECPLEGRVVGAVLGLPDDGDWDGIDPLDGVAVSAETLRARFAGLAGAWKAIAQRGLEGGLLVRRST